MSEIQQTRWDRIIRRVSGSVGTGSHVSETLSELFPVIDVERVPGELLLLGGTQLAMGTIVVSPVAANFSLAMLRNPGGSKTLITVTKVLMSASATIQGNAGVTLNTFGTAGSQAIRDTRRGPADPPVGLVLGEVSLVFGVDFFRFILTGGMNTILEDENSVAVLAPGTAFAVGALSTNTAIRASFFWRERPAEESELQF